MAKDWKSKKKGEQAHVAPANEEAPALPLAVCEPTTALIPML